MKTSIWDILTGITLLGILCLIGGFGVVLANPATPLNPLQPPKPQTVATIALPTRTNTATPGLPPTWTPTPPPTETEKSAAPEGLRPSSTPLPTSTVLVLPTFTPSRTPRVGTGGGSCQVVSQIPADNTILNKGQSFDMNWTIKNTSSKTWDGGSTDIRFVSGDRVHVGNDVRDIGYDVAPNGMISIISPLSAPSSPGSYVTNFSMSQGNTSVCRFYLQFQVQ